MTRAQAASSNINDIFAGDIFAGGGEMGALMRSHDWSQTPLGSVETWSHSLCTALNICLQSRFPMVIWWGPHLVLLYNDAWRPALGSTKHPQALGRPGREVWPEVWHIIGPQLEGVLATGTATWADDMLLLVERHGYQEETYYTYSYSPILDETGKVGGVFTAVNETTQRVLGERRLHTLQNLAFQAGQAKTAEQACQAALQTLAENSADIPFALLYLISADGKQARLCATTALAPDTPASPSCIDFSQPETESGWSLFSVIQTGETALVENLQQRFGVLPSGSWNIPPQQALVIPLYAAGQERLVGLLVVGVNPCRALDNEFRNFFEMTAGHIATAITNARAYEEECKRSEALAELDRAKTLFFNNVSHEFRTPLTLMLSPLENLLTNSSETLPSHRDQLEFVHRNALRLLKLVNTLLDFSRIEAGRMQAVYEPTDLATLTIDLAGVFRAAIEQAGLQLQVDCPSIPELVYVDREMWDKIVLNLLSNAFKFTFEGEIAVSLRWADVAIELEVRDTGIGIPAEELPRLFERFHRVPGSRGRTYEGSGIGLSLVQELVQLHGGTMAVESVVDQGTRFIVSIPTGYTHLPSDRIQAIPTVSLTASTAVPYLEEVLRWLPKEEGEKGEQAEGGKPFHNSPTHSLTPSPSARILLVDDNADMREYVTRLLSSHYEVEAVADGTAALEAVRNRLPDLVLTDVMMPRLDGFGLLKALRADEYTRDLLVILLTARAGEESRIEGLEAGADDYLIKPFSGKELLARIKANLEMARLRKESAQRERQLRAEAETVRDQVRNILESITDAFVAFDHQWRYTYVNQAAAQILQKTPLELIGKHVWEEVFPSEVGGIAYRELHRAVAEQVPVSWEDFSQIIHRWLEATAYPSADGIAVYFRDVTERKQAEAERERLHQELATERALLEAVLQQMPAGVIIAEAPSGKLVLGNEQVQQIWRHPFLPSSQIEQHQEYKGFHQDGRLYAPEEWPLARSILTGEIIKNEEIQFLRGDGTYGVMEVNSTPIQGADGKIIAGVVVFDDITNRKEIEEELCQSEERFRLAARAVAGIVYDWNIQTGEVYRSEGLYWLIGLRPEDALPTQAWWTERIHPDDLARISPVWLSILAGSDNRYDFEYRVRHEGGHWVDVWDQGYLIRDKNGNLLRVVGSSADITDRKRAEAEREHLLARERSAREEAEAANRIKDEFLAVLSHELRTPLNPILGWAQLLQLREFDKTAVKTALETIERNAKLQAQLIEDLLDVSRILQGKLSVNMAPVNLGSTIKAAMETVRLAAEVKNIQIQTMLDPAVGYVLGDTARLQQVVWNLLSNAVKFTPPGGQVNVRLEQVGTRGHGGQGGEVEKISPTPVSSPAPHTLLYAQITVSDTGKGINPEFLPYVFDSFRQADSTITRKFGGLGLGLAIVRHLVEMHGGIVWAQSPGEEQGTTLTVRLPLMKEQLTMTEETNTAPSFLCLAGIEILIVDNDADTCEFFSFALEEFGAVVTAVSSANEALQALSLSKPDVLLSDIEMPQMDGYTFMQKVRSLEAQQERQQIPAIALSAYASEINQQQALSAGFQMHIAKPVAPEELLKVICELVGCRGSILNF